MKQAIHITTCRFCTKGLESAKYLHKYEHGFENETGGRNMSVRVWMIEFEGIDTRIHLQVIGAIGRCRELRVEDPRGVMGTFSVDGFKQLLTIWILLSTAGVYCEREGTGHSKEDSRSLRRLEELEDSIVGTEIDAYIIQPGVLERLIKTSR
ncbi:uncharacterized protein CLUP02_09276 [Colletotrichum lupini]|uniref:Uncharacterized protein n=1 Tax=Colletotrichum lupini TaxID=145971 RepID=A0A9Q8WIF6_9PEZI|nr:uncharacterized protein CLUP02_09276 [Colletotrichum lupini]UQC83780.1 hypothetical protein CLUP02_09276 [Colletotrichum lupini]